jgi:hypothetical protein
MQESSRDTRRTTVIDLAAYRAAHPRQRSLPPGPAPSRGPRPLRERQLNHRARMLRHLAALTAPV